MKIPITDLIVDFGENRRPDFAPSSCDGLAQTIARIGQLTPVGVTKEGDKYRLVHGFRRYTAIATILEWDHIHIHVLEDMGGENDVANLVENIQREDLDFFAECQAIKAVFPDCSQTEIAQALGVSRGWVRPRFLIWELPEEVILKVSFGLLTSADVNLLVQKQIEDKQAAADEIILAKAEGESRDAMAGRMANRKSRMTKKVLQRMITKLVDVDETRCADALRFACGEITDETFLNRIGYISPKKLAEISSGDGEGSSGDTGD